MTRPADFLEEVTHHASDLDSLDYGRLRSQLAERSVVRVTGLLDRDEIRAAHRRIVRDFDPANDRKHDPRDTEAVRRNFQKLQVGANSGMDTRRTLGRFLRILYNPIFAPDVHGLRGAFARVARFRNRLYGLPEDFAVEGTDDGLFTCARIHQYPRGGGFMVPHRDLFSRLVTEESDMGYFQVFFLLTEKGVDYVEGGAYVEHDGERILFEDAARAGDVLVYDGRSIHGVADIDPLEPLELDRFGGRAAAFVSLFRHLEAGEAGYGSVSREAVKRFAADVGSPTEGKGRP
ncbi:MAG: hypothetical protein ACKO2K_18970 [Alphaproteobacteria bacterium]